ncbi:Serpin domain containing protein, partial [Asbolus verrucosus]
MPFVGGDVSMVFVLPNEKDGLASLENQMEKVFAPQNPRREFLFVALPKFKIETTIQLVNILKNENEKLSVRPRPIYVELLEKKVIL